MYLVLSKEIYEDRRFIIFLTRRIRNQILKSINLNKLKPWDDYFSKKYNEPIKTFNIIKLGVDNITYTEYTDIFKIGINNNVFVPNLDAKLNDICKEINYGNMDMRAYPIFTDVFEYIKKYIQKYLNWYTLFG